MFVVRMGKERCIQGFCVQNSVKRPSRRWKDNIKIGLKEIGWEGMDWIDYSGWGQLVGCREGDNQASGPIKCGEFLGYLRRTLLCRVSYLNDDN